MFQFDTMRHHEFTYYFVWSELNSNYIDMPYPVLRIIRSKASISISIDQSKSSINA